MHPAPLTDHEQADYETRFPARLEEWLDNCHGACALAQPDIRALVEGALSHFDGERYHLGEFVVMPNHVHVIVMPIAPWSLPQILHSWKSYTSNHINRSLNQAGEFWQKESFDHIVRSDVALAHFVRYIRDNPTRKTRCQ